MDEEDSEFIFDLNEVGKAVGEDTELFRQCQREDSPPHDPEDQNRKNEEHSFTASPEQEYIKEAGVGGHPTGSSIEHEFKPSAEEIKRRVAERLEQETREKARTSHSMRLALQDQQFSQDTIPVALALVDFLAELKQNLEQRPEEFYCSLKIPSKHRPSSSDDDDDEEEIPSTSN